MTTTAEREHTKLVAIQEMLPRLREHLPHPLFAELCANIYLLPPEPLTEADIAWGHQVARDLGRAE